MNFIEKLYKKRKITIQLLKTNELGGFDAIEDSLAKLCNEHEDFAIYFFQFFNGLYEKDVELFHNFYRNVMQSKKIVISSKILRESIYNKYLPMYFANYRNRLTKEQIISILNENFSSYYKEYAETLLNIMRYGLGPEYYDIINALIIKYPTYKSAYYIVCAIEHSSDCSDKMIDAMIATNNLEHMRDLAHYMKYFRHLDVPKKLEDKIEELEKKKDEKLRKKIEKYDKELEKYQDKPEEYTAEYIEKQKRKLKQSQDKLQASVNNL